MQFIHLLMRTYDRDCFYLFCRFSMFCPISNVQLSFLFTLLSSRTFIYVESKSDTYPNDFFFFVRIAFAVKVWKSIHIFMYVSNGSLCEIDRQNKSASDVVTTLLLIFEGNDVFKLTLSLFFSNSHRSGTAGMLNIERVHKSFNYVSRDCCTVR